MDTYKQIHDFTATGAARFAEFLSIKARPDVSPAVCRLECLGVIEDNLNSATGGPLAWELGALESNDGKRHTFAAVEDDLIIEVVRPDE